MRILLVFPIFAVLTSCRATLDGGFEGSSNCGGGTQTMTAVLDEQDDGQVEGLLYIELDTVFGKVIGRYVVENGWYDNSDPPFPYALVLRKADGRPDFDLRLRINSNNPDVVEGIVDEIADNGAKTGECDLTLNRVSVAGN
jgi:hypothetical protein